MGGVHIKAVSVEDTWARLKSDTRSVLIDVRTIAEWAYVGLPDLSAIGKQPVLVEWQGFPDNRPNTAFVERVYADDYVVTGANGVVRTRPQVIADMKSGVQTFESMKNDDVKVRSYGDTAIVTGRTTQKGQYKGQPSLSPTLFTRVYVKRDGQWHLVANSSSAYLEVE